MARTKQNQRSANRGTVPVGATGGRTPPSKLTVALLATSVLAAVWAAAMLTPGGRIAYAYLFVYSEFYFGVLALVFLSITVMAGVLATDRMMMTVRQRVLLQSAHRTTGVISVASLVVHVVTKLSMGRITGMDALVPFLAANNTFYVGLGTVAGFFMVSVLWTGLIRARFIGRGKPWMWRSLHSTTYLAWPIALVHGLNAGRAAAGWVIAAYLVCVLLVVIALLVRLSVAINRRKDFSSSTSTGSIKPVGKVVPTATPSPRRRAERRPEVAVEALSTRTARATAPEPVRDLWPEPARAAAPDRSAAAREERTAAARDLDERPARDPDDLDQRDERPARRVRGRDVEESVGRRRSEDRREADDRWDADDEYPVPRTRAGRRAAVRPDDDRWDDRYADEDRARRRRVEPADERPRGRRAAPDDDDYELAREVPLPRSRRYADDDTPGRPRSRRYADDEVPERARRPRRSASETTRWRTDTEERTAVASPRARRAADDDEPVRRRSRRYVGDEDRSGWRVDGRDRAEVPQSRGYADDEPRRGDGRHSRGAGAVRDERRPADTWSADTWSADLNYLPPDDTPTLIDMASRRARRAASVDSVRGASRGARRRAGTDDLATEERYWRELRGEAQ